MYACNQIQDHDIEHRSAAIQWISIYEYKI